MGSFFFDYPIYYIFADKEKIVLIYKSLFYVQ